MIRETELDDRVPHREMVQPTMVEADGSLRGKNLEGCMFGLISEHPAFFRYGVGDVLGAPHRVGNGRVYKGPFSYTELLPQTATRLRVFQLFPLPVGFKPEGPALYSDVHRGDLHTWVHGDGTWCS